MRRIYALSACVVAALALGVITAGAASAKTVLELNEAKVHVPVGTKAVSEVLVQNCLAVMEGEVTKNGSTKDKAALTTEAAPFCFGSDTISGGITEAAFSPKGIASYKADIKLTTEAGCTYEFKKLSTPFTANEGTSGGFGEMTGKRSKTSSKTCVSKLSVTFTAGIANTERESFETELAV